MARKGPIPKGDRAGFTFKLPADDLEYYRAEAERHGLPTGDYLAVCLAEAHGRDVPGYVHRRDRIDQLALEGIAIGA